MTTQELAEEVAMIIRNTSDDINDYLKSDVPLECYKDDIDDKLFKMKVKVIQAIKYARLT